MFKLKVNLRPKLEQKNSFSIDGSQFLTKTLEKIKQSKISISTPVTSNDARSYWFTSLLYSKSTNSNPINNDIVTNTKFWSIKF